jgi:dienelactone hydrolase
MIKACLLLLAALSIPSLATAADAAAPTGLLHDVVFTHYSPYSRSEELMRRLLTPLTGQRMRVAMAKHALSEQAINLADEKFAVYVPAHAPANGYAVLVYVPPWEEAAVPKAWLPVLDAHGMIFVSAAKSGNDAKILDRRQPLALLAAQNIMQRYPIDPNRIYVGGFSGGSRVAMRIALGYPDLFRGALLNAGSDPIGDNIRPLPPVDLFHQFQESMRLVYFTNREDAMHLEWDRASRQSMQEWCVFDTHTESGSWAGHDVPDAIIFNHALTTLDARSEIDPKKLAECRTRVDQEMAAQLQKVDALRASGHVADASRLLIKIDEHYGGLAAPRSVELAQKLEAAH